MLDSCGDAFVRPTFHVVMVTSLNGCAQLCCLLAKGVADGHEDMLTRARCFA